MAEWSKALVLGTSPKGRGFESHRCQNLFGIFSSSNPRSFFPSKIEDVKDKFTVGDKLKMNAKKKNNVWQVQCLEWPKWGLKHPQGNTALTNIFQEFVTSVLNNFFSAQMVFICEISWEGSGVGKTP